jgi:hypothetical protein
MDILGVKPETWFPVVTLVLGAALKWISDLVIDKRRHASEKEARAEARQDILSIRATEFQREALLKLQAAAQVLARAAGRSHYEDRKASSEGHPWGSRPLSREANEMSLDGQVRLTRYRVRIGDDVIRNLAEKFSDATAKRVTAESEKQADLAMSRAMEAFAQLNEKIGIALRARN